MPEVPFVAGKIIDMKSEMIETLDHCRIAWSMEGPDEAPVLLLSNSLGTDRSMWDAQMAAWRPHYRVLRYDSRGHGASGAPGGGYSMDRLGRDVIELLDQLGIERVHFCGLSLGGMIGQWLAVHAPERIDRLILANTSAYMGPAENWQRRIDDVLAKGMEWLTDASLSRWFTPAFIEQSSEDIAPLRSVLLGTSPIGYTGCCAAIRDMDQRPVAGLNQLPTLVIAGDQDAATTVADAEFLAESAASGHLEILAAAHLSNAEVPDQFARLVLDFLSKP